MDGLGVHPAGADHARVVLLYRQLEGPTSHRSRALLSRVLDGRAEAKAVRHHGAHRVKVVAEQRLGQGDRRVEAVRDHNAFGRRGRRWAIERFRLFLFRFPHKKIHGQGRCVELREPELSHCGFALPQ